MVANGVVCDFKWW